MSEGGPRSRKAIVNRFEAARVNSFVLDESCVKISPVKNVARAIDKKILPDRYVQTRVRLQSVSVSYRSRNFEDSRIPRQDYPVRRHT